MYFYYRILWNIFFNFNYFGSYIYFKEFILFFSQKMNLFIEFFGSFTSVIGRSPCNNDSWLCMVFILPKPNYGWCLLHFFCVTFIVCLPQDGYLRHYLPLDQSLSTFAIKVGAFVIYWHFSGMFLAFPYFSLLMFFLIFFLISDFFLIYECSVRTFALLSCSLLIWICHSILVSFHLSHDISFNISTG